ncbi:MAG: DUF177 domain-containing protein [Cyclobacteriaceae bacterium]
MKTSEARDFLVNIPSLKNGEHEFHHEIKNSFFERFDGDLVEKGNGKSHLVLKKSETMMQLAFELDLKVELICDRSLEPFQFPIKENHELIVKFGDHDEELSEDLIVINRETQTFDVAPYLYEFIGLSIPMKKLHPKFEGQESPTLVYQTETEEETSEEVDPRWEALKKLSNK